MNKIRKEREDKEEEKDIEVVYKQKEDVICKKLVGIL